MERLCAGKPKAFIADEIQKPALLFTDGALEYDGDEPCATIGAVCIFPDGSTKCQRRFWMFGEKVARLMLLGWWNFMLALSSKVSGQLILFATPSIKSKRFAHNTASTLGSHLCLLSLSALASSDAHDVHRLSLCMRSFTISTADFVRCSCKHFSKWSGICAAASKGYHKPLARLTNVSHEWNTPKTHSRTFVSVSRPADKCFVSERTLSVN